MKALCIMTLHFCKAFFCNLIAETVGLRLTLLCACLEYL